FFHVVSKLKQNTQFTHNKKEEESSGLEKKLSFLREGEKQKQIFILFVVCIVLYFLIPKFLFFVFAIILAALSRLFQRFCPFEIGVELVTIFTVCFSIIYGPLIGAVYAFISMTITLMVSDELKERWSFIAVLSILIIALIAGVFPYEKYLSFAIYGFLLALLYDVLFDLIYSVTISRMNIFKRIIFYITHLYFNYFLFLYFGQKILAFLGG
ncbi:MAG: hypothetical protein KAI55_05055, partial [Candidatus Aenigmarchaeota archaeon]|nr:hypothetical protein [Candidatus Aenigmarchaeota archaeon]